MSTLLTPCFVSVLGLGPVTPRLSGMERVRDTEYVMKIRMLVPPEEWHRSGHTEVSVPT